MTSKGVAWDYDELSHRALPSAISSYLTAGTPPTSMMSWPIAATADVLADLIVDLLERWDHLDEYERTFRVVVHLSILRELEHLKGLDRVIEASLSDVPTGERTVAGVEGKPPAESG